MVILWLWIIGGIVSVAVCLVWWWKATTPEDLDDDLLEALWRLK